MSPFFLLYEYSTSQRLESLELDRMSLDHGVAGRRKDEEASTLNNGASAFFFGAPPKANDPEGGPPYHLA